MIYIALDTNILYLPDSSRFDELKMSSSFLEIVKLASDSSLRDQVTVLLPEIAIKELWKQRCDYYVSSRDKLLDEASKFGTLLSISFSPEFRCYKDFFQTQIDDYLYSLEHVEQLPICDSKFFKGIVERSLNKEPPFEGIKGKADKGFKDTVIFYSLLSYAETNPGEYILVTKDNRLKEISLRSYFRSFTGKELKVFEEVAHVKDEIANYTSDLTINEVEINFCPPKEYYRGNPSYETKMSIRVSKPKIIESAPILKRINNDIDEIYKEAENEWDAIDLQAGPYWPEMEYEGSINAEITYNSSGLLSILITKQGYYGGAHGGRSYIGRVYDLNTGCIIKLSRLLQMTEGAVLETIRDIVKKEKERHTYNYYEDFVPPYMNEDEINWYVRDSTIHIIFNEYEAGCYASGMHEVVISL